MDINENLPGLLGNLTQNRAAIAKNLAQAEQAVSQLDAESLASIQQLLAKWQHPQSVGQFINALAQAEGLKKALGELDTAVAVLQAASADDAFLADAQAQLTANETGTNANPLPAAGQSGASAPAADSAGADVAQGVASASA